MKIKNITLSLIICIAQASSVLSAAQTTTRAEGATATTQAQTAAPQRQIVTPKAPSMLLPLCQGATLGVATYATLFAATRHGLPYLQDVAPYGILRTFVDGTVNLTNTNGFGFFCKSTAILAGAYWGTTSLAKSYQNHGFALGRALTAEELTIQERLTTMNSTLTNLKASSDAANKNLKDIGKVGDSLKASVDRLVNGTNLMTSTVSGSLQDVAKQLKTLVQQYRNPSTELPVQQAPIAVASSSSPALAREKNEGNPFNAESLWDNQNKK